MDAAMAFWQEAMSRFTPPGAANSGAAPAGGVDPAAWMPTPEMAKRMQSAFLDAMTTASEQYMRSPQFMESMKSSFDSALQMRRQMEDYLRRNVGDAARTPGDAEASVVAALHEMEGRLNRRLDELADRIDRLEGERRSSGRGSSSTARASSGGGRRSASKKT